MKAFATWGQYTPMAVGIFAVKTVESLTAAVSDLTDDQGHKIPASLFGFAVGTLHAHAARPNRLLSCPLHPRKAVHSERPRRQERVLLADRVCGNPQMPGGLYRGQVLLKAAGLPEQRVPIALRVLPFALDETSKWFHHPACVQAEHHSGGAGRRLPLPATSSSTSANTA